MRKLWVLSIVALTAAAGAGSALAAAAKKAAKKAAPAAEEAGGIDKARFEKYLKDRVAKIKEAHNARMAFFANEEKLWKTFWEKVRDERQVFEVRVTRQTLDIFESLNSLDPKDHPTTIANFERMHGDMMRSFEQQQRQKMNEFFAEREARWKEFAADQEKERTDFIAEAQSGWQDNKDQLANAVAAKVEGEQAADEGEKAEKEKKPAKTAARKTSTRRQASPFSNDNWH